MQGSDLPPGHLNNIDLDRINEEKEDFLKLDPNKKLALNKLDLQ